MIRSCPRISGTAAVKVGSPPTGAAASDEGEQKTDPKRDKDESRVFGLERSRFESVTIGVHWPWHCSKNENKMK